MAGRARIASVAAGALLALVAVVASAAQPRTVTVTPLLRVAFTSPSRGVGLFVRSTTPENGIGNGRCAFFTRATTDGGASFGVVGATIATTSCASGYLVVGFAVDGAGDVFAYGPGLFVSHDGGASWRPQKMPGTLLALTAVRRSVWALSDSCSAPTSRAPTCRLTLLVSADGGRSWAQAARQPPNRSFSSEFSGPSTWLWREDAQRAVVIVPHASYPPSANTVILEQTLDGGAHWSSTPAPCAAAPLSVEFSIAPDGARWFACAGEPGAGEQEKSFARSLDGGRTWLAGASPCLIGTIPTCHHGMPLRGYLGGLAALSPTTAFYVGGRSSLTYTHDGGRSWHVEPDFSGDPSGTSEVTFVNATDGWALDEGFGGHPVLWRTRDGGTQWTRLNTA
jgi:photosystem II stability/assembly factor-like uncharacterized protein